MRSVLTFAAISLGAFLSSLLILPAVLNSQTIVYTTYPVLLATFFVWIYSLAQLDQKTGALRKLLPRRPSAWAMILFVSLIHLLLEPFGFKIAYDEVILSVTAEIMHFTRMSGLAQWANDYTGNYEFFNIFLDKRPFFFPFLVSLLHDLTGYRFQNVFILNGFLTISFVTGLYAIGRALSGHRAGLLTVLLSTALPLISIAATGGHFEMLNLFMLSVTLLLAFIYISKPTAIRLVPLVYALLLLSQVRYESVIYLLPFGLIILAGWKKAGDVILPWPVMLAPVLLINSALQMAFVFKGERQFFQAGPEGRDTTFSAGYFIENIRSSIEFLFSAGFTHPNSLLLTVLGLTALMFCLVYFWKGSGRCLGKNPRLTSALAITIGVLCMTLVLLFFNHGLLHNYITNRLSLPLYLLFIILIPFAGRRFGSIYLNVSLVFGLLAFTRLFYKLPREGSQAEAAQMGIAVLVVIGISFWVLKNKFPTLRALTLVSLLYLVTVSLPVGHSREYTHRYLHDRIVAKELAFLQEKSRSEKILWVTAAPYTAFLSRVNSVPSILLNSMPELGKHHLDSGYYDAIYYSRLMVKKGSGPFQLKEPMNYLDPKVFAMEVVDNLYLGFDERMEILKITEINPVE
jgi:hypothetical protein